MSSPPSPSDLLGRVALRDREAFGLLYDQYAPLVFKLALRMMRDRAEAEDLLQEVFIQVWRTAASYDSRRGHPAAWLTTIARSRAIDRLRSAEYRRHKRETADVERVEGASDLRHEVSLRESAAAVRDAVVSLPEDQRRAIELAYFDGLTQSEVARKLGQPLGTVKTRIRLGMLKLRGMLAQEPDRVRE